MLRESSQRSIFFELSLEELFAKKKYFSGLWYLFDTIPQKLVTIETLKLVLNQAQKVSEKTRYPSILPKRLIKRSLPLSWSQEDISKLLSNENPFFQEMGLRVLGKKAELWDREIKLKLILDHMKNLHARNFELTAHTLSLLTCRKITYKDLMVIFKNSQVPEMNCKKFDQSKRPGSSL